MSLENRPDRSRVPQESWAERRDAYKRKVDRAYVDLRAPRIDPRDPAGTLRRMFGDAVVAEAQIAQVVSTSLGRGITELAARGVPLEEIAPTELTKEDAARNAKIAKDVHDLLGGPPLPEAFMARRLEEVVFPLAGMGAAFNAINSLSDGRIIPQSRPGIVEVEDAPPPPHVTLPAVQAFFNADPHNPEIARRSFEVALTTLLDHRADRDEYHSKLLGASRQSELIDIRAEFGGKMIGELTRALTPDSVPRASERQLHAFANNIVAYVIA